MQVLPSARKHAIPGADIEHAFRHASRFIPFEHDGQERLLVIGPDRSGDVLELVAFPARDPGRIIHADRLRPNYYELLR